MSGICIFRTSLKFYFAASYRAERFVQKLLKISKMPFYAVANGRTKGIYNSWADCEAQVKGFSGAKFKKFDTVSGAKDFIKSNTVSVEGLVSAPTKSCQSTSCKNLKRSYSTSSTSNSGGPTYNKKLKKSSEASGDSLHDIITKQLDIIEKRVDAFSIGIVKIVQSATKASHKMSRQAIFEVDSEGYVQVYTDGACLANGKRGARAGLGVYWGDNHCLNRSQPVSGRATNNCGEIQAATLAIKLALENGLKKLTINTDSQFLINSATKWMPGWKRRGWKLSSGESVKNELDFKDLDSVLNKLSIKWNFVRAHNGLYGNEMADKFAKAGAAKYK